MSYELSSALIIKIAVFLLVSFLLALVFFNQKIALNFKSSISEISPKVQLQLKKSNWHENCPINLNELASVKFSYWGFDNRTHLGGLIVNKELAKEVVDIFKVLYINKFPIQKIAIFNEDDNTAMAANITSAFKCREVTGQPGIFSQHSYGRAIDINPLINPYVKNKIILPFTGAKFVDRNIYTPGKITKDSIVYKEFINHGWDWGGSWFDLQDYQHFEKRAHGERRNPYGYENNNSKKENLDKF